jgi:hypothetical protein
VTNASETRNFQERVDILGEFLFNCRSICFFLKEMLRLMEEPCTHCGNRSDYEELFHRLFLDRKYTFWDQSK